MTLIMRSVLGLILAATAGCLRDDRAQRDRGAAGIFENIQTVKAPLKDRCAAFKDSGAGKRCEEARYLGRIYVRRLDVGTDVCLEGGFGESPHRNCLARAAVVDARPDQVLIEVREAKPDSKWFHKEQNQFWFEEGALVDLYLADQGY